MYIHGWNDDTNRLVSARQAQELRSMAEQFPRTEGIEPPISYREQQAIDLLMKATTVLVDDGE